MTSTMNRRSVADSVENLRNLQDDNPAVVVLLVELFAVRANEVAQPWSGVAAGVVHLLAALSGVAAVELQRMIDDVVADTGVVREAA